MKTLNLNDLLADLEKTAGIEKTASVTKPNVSAELSNILEKKASEDVTLSAHAAGEALAKELLTKLAAENEIQIGNDAIVAADNAKVVPNQTAGTIDAPLDSTVAEALARGAKSDNVVDEIEDAKQTKEAQIKSENTQMAKSIMEKIAQIVGEPTTTPAAEANVEGAVAPNLIQTTNEEMTEADDAKVLPLPGAEGSLNSILEAVVARAEAQGAVSDDLVNGDAPASSAPGDSQVLTAEDEQEKAAAVSALVEAGCDFESAISMVKEAEQMLKVEADQQEKVAAITELCAAGYDFESAVELVKQAEAELNGENSEIEKAAAVQELMGQGHSFEDSVELVKQAVDMEGTITKAKIAASKAGEKVKETAGKAYEGAKAGAGKAYEGARTAAGKAVPFVKAHKGKIGLVGAGLAAAGAGVYAATRKHEKKAAFDALVEAGIDFDQATAMVKQAEIDVYGEE